MRRAASEYGAVSMGALTMKKLYIRYPWICPDTFSGVRSQFSNCRRFESRVTGKVFVVASDETSYKPTSGPCRWEFGVASGLDP
jgi:hypothetical protein